MRVKGVAHIGMIVKNLEKTIEFYRDILGLEVSVAPTEPFTDPEEGLAMGILDENASHSHREAILKLQDGSTIELIEFSEPEPLTVPPTAACIGKLHIGFQVDDIQRWVEKLKQHGVEPFRAPREFDTDDAEGGIGYWMYMRDPDGTIIEMQQF